MSTSRLESLKRGMAAVRWREMKGGSMTSKKQAVGVGKEERKEKRTRRVETNSFHPATLSPPPPATRSLLTVLTVRRLQYGLWSFQCSA